MKDLIFYTHPNSRGRTVRWMLEECGADYETHFLTYNDTMKAPDYLEINPMGKVPALVHQGKVVTEQAAIVTYLADIFPEKKLAPQNRADYYRWLFFIAGPLEAAIVDRMLSLDIKPEMQTSIGYGTLELTVKTLENWLENRTYIAADHFTAADCLAVTACFYFLKTGFIKSEILSAYCAHHMQRPAYQTAMAIDDAAFEGYGKI